jgi:hypothetical protein
LKTFMGHHQANQANVSALAGAGRPTIGARTSSNLSPPEGRKSERA